MSVVRYIETEEGLHIPYVTTENGKEKPVFFMRNVSINRVEEDIESLRLILVSDNDTSFAQWNSVVYGVVSAFAASHKDITAHIPTHTNYVTTAKKLYMAEICVSAKTDEIAFFMKNTLVETYTFEIAIDGVRVSPDNELCVTYRIIDMTMCEGSGLDNDDDNDDNDDDNDDDDTVADVAEPSIMDLRDMASDGLIKLKDRAKRLDMFADLMVGEFGERVGVNESKLIEIRTEADEANSRASEAEIIIRKIDAGEVINPQKIYQLMSECE